MNCPECRSSDIERIGLYDYKCNSCGYEFDASEASVYDDNDYHEDWGNDD